MWLLENFKSHEARHPPWLTPVILARLEMEAGGPPEVRSLRPGWPTWRNPVSTKNTKISWAWWRVPVIPATWEAEAGELPEPRRWRLQWAEILPLHSSLGNKSSPSSDKYSPLFSFISLMNSVLYFPLSSLCRCFFSNSGLQNLRPYLLCGMRWGS